MGFQSPSGFGLAIERPQPPSALFAELFEHVQASRLFPDSKLFADLAPKAEPDAILEAYRQAQLGTPDELMAFVERWFRLPAEQSHEALSAAITALWPSLLRSPQTTGGSSSEIPLKFPYVIPGGRFREIYYWDCFFTLLGLVEDGRIADAVSTLDNLADLIARFGRAPNGTRTYYLSRSQPPVLYLIVELLAERGAIDPRAYLPAMKAELDFWMRGAEALKPGEAAARAVRLPDGALLNRYWDDVATPRDEAFFEDVTLARRAGRPEDEVFRDVRAAAESGWDFSSRWLGDPQDLATIETTAIVPVDLNALLWGLEVSIARISRAAGDDETAKRCTRCAADRKAAVERWLWDERAACFGDLNWRRLEPTRRISAAAAAPLFVALASQAKADATIVALQRHLLRAGGLVTTAVHSGQQWDAPNGWAPLQWMAVMGAARYGHCAFARTVADRWLRAVNFSYDSTGLFFEKYDVEALSLGGGGEYPLQQGFGWTNGVTQALLKWREAQAQP